MLCNKLQVVLTVTGQKDELADWGWSGRRCASWRPCLCAIDLRGLRGGSDGSDAPAPPTTPTRHGLLRPDGKWRNIARVSRANRCIDVYEVLLI